jgi:hypothetical protein
VLGPFELGEYKPGAYVCCGAIRTIGSAMRTDRALPYLDSIRLEIQQNRELELLRFRRGELDIINKLDPEMYDRLSSEMPHAVVDAGPSLDWETVFFNQVENAPLPEYKRRWFRSERFPARDFGRHRRDDMVRIVYHGHARPPRAGFRGKPFLVESRAPAASGSESAALALLERAGFRRSGSTLVDRDGNKVEFSMITNAGNKLHERMLALIQQDLARWASSSTSWFWISRRWSNGSAAPQLRVGADGLVQRRSRPQRADEHLAEFGGESPMESQRENARDRLGSRDRQIDAGAECGSQDPKKRKPISTRCSRSWRTRRRCCSW